MPNLEANHEVYCTCCLPCMLLIQVLDLKKKNNSFERDICSHHVLKFQKNTFKMELCRNLPKFLIVHFMDNCPLGV